MKRRLLVILLIGCGLALWFFLKPVEGLIGPVDLPANDGFLRSQEVQWWYWTGHLQTDEGREFGFEVVFFVFDSWGFFRSQLTQAAVTDVQANRYQFEENVYYGLPRETPGKFNLKAKHGEIVAQGGNGTDHIKAKVKDYEIDLNLKAAKPPVLHYDGNAHPFAYGGYTYYYSREHMLTSGTIRFEGKTYQVTGTSWFDRQYGELYQSIVKGWQWFAIELDDDRQIMIYDFRGEFAPEERYASITGPDGQTKDVGPDGFKVEPLGSWTSPETGCTYPSGWTVTIDQMTLEVHPVVLNQELCAEHGFWAGPEYWEGKCSVSGDVTGKAYVELNGYCRGAEGSVNL